MIKLSQVFGSNHINEAVIAPIQRPHLFIQAVVATGGVYKGQGRNQRELMSHAY